MDIRENLIRCTCATMKCMSTANPIYSHPLLNIHHSVKFQVYLQLWLLVLKRLVGQRCQCSLVKLGHDSGRLSSPQRIWVELDM